MADEGDGPVVVTGLGAASALGTGIAVHLSALEAGRDGLRAIARFDTERMSGRGRLGGTWPGWDGRRQPVPGPDQALAATAASFPLHELALVAAREAWGEAACGAADPRRVALVFGTCFGHGFDEFHAVAERIAARLGIRGPCITISTACASSTNAMGLGRDLLARGHADVVVAGSRPGRCAVGGLRLRARSAQRRQVRPLQRARGDDARRGRRFRGPGARGRRCPARGEELGQHPWLWALGRRLPRDDPGSLRRRSRARHSRRVARRRMGSSRRRLRERPRHGHCKQRSDRVVRHRARARRSQWAARGERLEEPARAHSGRRRHPRACPRLALPARRSGASDAQLPRAARRMSRRSGGRCTPARAPGGPCAEALGGVRWGQPSTRTARK